MLPRSTLPKFVAEPMGLKKLLPGSRTERATVLFIMANPGDEIIAAGASLPKLSHATFLHVTNGAPLDLHTALDAGFSDRQEYAEERRKQFAAALEHAGQSETESIQLEYPAGEISRNLAALTMEMVEVFRERKPDAVVTHACEGLCPDHDAIAFATQNACALIESHGGQPPVRIETAACPEHRHHKTVGEFAQESDTECAALELLPEELEFKEELLALMPIRQAKLRGVSLARESFRIAPPYNFTEVHFERSSERPLNSRAALNERRWRRLACDALRVLGLAVA